MSRLKDVRILATAGMLIALAALFSFFSVPVTQTLEVRFKFIPIACGGWLFGPVIGGLIGGLADIIGYLVKPTGPFMPGFTISTVLTGVIYGAFLHRRQPTLKRVLSAVLANAALVSVLFNTANLCLTYGLPWKATLITRLPQQIFFIPANTALLYFSMRALNKLILRTSLRHSLR